MKMSTTQTDNAWVENFRDNLRSAMEKLGITQQELSERSGVHYVTISRILSGDTDDPSVGTCEKLAKAAGFQNPKIFFDPAA